MRIRNILLQQSSLDSHPSNTAEDVVSSTTKYSPLDMIDRREDVSAMTYPFKLKKYNELINPGLKRPPFI